LIAALALPLLAPTPASAGNIGDCPEGYYGPNPIFVYQNSDYPRGIARAAAAADVNHNELVCYQYRGQRGALTFIDDIVYFGG
jgi:hypothetical protein